MRTFRGHDDRPADRPEDRPGQSPALAAARRRGPGREFEQLRRGLQLRVHEQHLVVDAFDAAADGAEPAGGLRAHVRRRQHGRRAGRAPGAGSAAFSIRSRAACPASAPTSARRIAAGSIEYAEDVREIERRLQIADEGLGGCAGRDERPGRRAGIVRRAHQAAVRSAGAGVSGRTSRVSPRCCMRATSPPEIIPRAASRSRSTADRTTEKIPSGSTNIPN